MRKYKDLVVRNSGQRLEFIHPRQGLSQGSDLQTERLAFVVVEFFVIVIIPVNADRKPFRMVAKKRNHLIVRCDRNSTE